MSDFPKILNHPDRDQIISRLTSGNSVREVSSWLKEKYPEIKDNQISSGLLDQFRRKYLNLHGTILEDLKCKIREQQSEEKQTSIQQIIKKNKTYKDKLEEFVDDQLDLKKKLHQFLNVAETRFAQLFDITQDNPNNLKPDKTMNDWFKNMLEIIREIRKADGSPDQIIQHNITVKALDETAAIFQQAMINTFAPLPIELASKLIDDFNNNLQELKKAQNNDIFINAKDVDKIETVVAKFLPENKDSDEDE